MLKTEQIRRVKYGNNVRYTFGKVKDSTEVPYLLEVQKNLTRNF